MNDLFKNQYKTNSTRLAGWDYTAGWYFVTICAKDKKMFFGKIGNGKMRLNQIGEVVKEELLKTPIIRRNVVLDKWVIMPNHTHMIIVITNNNGGGVETHCNASLPQTNKFGPQRNNLASIIRGFKGVTTKRIHLARQADFAWQPGFYDHILRDEKDYQNTWDYIDYNPDKWEWDKENPENLKKK
ncbi:hypothetical protein A3E04_03400 [Candidatus Kuenenbacteria bacterium RIFCSPHIGHO2_12_FULL_42_14]|uniref:Transposase IS200-like domain-containing protein n=4 Tax=Candidatus Kueneniibacteriota TaxID=1752740 RepID=A0A0G1BRR3_9BACT|nr:MAG: hypothetical protein UV02_C0046G0005 [Candidatus Kuenenbacteria bacterium GW2011_GWA2_42_15]OGG91426.1 MAG: hypothetical protein A3H55_03365 [Candidatus Kuenenbacteria bacterium RIFCSPLOWO2_02_FULL_42_16]OGG95905.1 MAG: hypothetical protein A2V95_03010 [Candidatus Kuenenbacteria bacterium RBG_16_41_7]OGH00176.1 MAG: hypothetical protein A3E04_03400 [Candidatus Kuenenbacteria bacterium RIFCSPHIGHO2_12_FULL_42_14]